MPSWRRGLWVLVAVALTSCSLGDRQARADLVTAAAIRTVTELGPLSGTVDAKVTVRFDDDVDPAQLGGVAIGDVISGDALGDQARARMYVDPDENRALLGPDGASPFPVVHFTDTVLALHLPDAESTARPWLAVGLPDLDTGSGAVSEDTFDGPGIAAGILSVLDPRLLLDLASGPLAGSIDAGTADELATATGAIEVTRYEANFDVPRVLEDARGEAYDDARLEVVETVLDLLNMGREVNPGTVWIDADGVVRRFDVTLRVDAGNLVAFDLDLSIAVEPTTTVDPDFALPTRDEVVRVDSLLPIARAAATASRPGLGGLIGG